MSILIALILLPFLFAAVVPPLYKYVRCIHTGWFVLAVPVVLFVYFLSCIPVIQGGEQLAAEIPWIPSRGIYFSVYLDGLGLLFALLISGIGALVVLYSIYYLSKSKEAIGQFYVYLLIFMGAMLGVVLSDHLMVLYGFWELTSISSFLLIAFWHKRERSRYGAKKSLMITVLGGMALLCGFIMLYIMTGTFSIREIIADLPSVNGHALFLPALLLVLLGAFTKSAQFPFHIWLPDAMEAPTPVSAYLHSATMVKAGIYLVARLSPVFAGQAEWFWLVSAFGMVTLLYGSLNAVKQTDLKALLAFSTISQLGLIMGLLGLGSAAAYYGIGGESLLYTTATTAAIFHLINHATFKGSLFMVAGIIDHETGTRDIRKLGGLAALMPVTFSIAAIGTLSMAGLPPFNGFLSKEMFFTAVLKTVHMDLFSLQTWGSLFPVIAWIASVFTFIYSMLLLFKTFMGKFQKDQWDRKPHEAPIGMLISPVVLASLVLVFGLFPNLLAYSLIEPAMASIMPELLAPGEKFVVSIQFWHGWTTELMMTFGVVAAGIGLAVSHKRWKGVYGRLPQVFSLNYLYDRGLGWLGLGSNRLTSGYMTGSIRSYLAYIFTFFILLLGYVLLRTPGIQFSINSTAPIAYYEIALVIALVLSTAAVPFARSRLTAIILTGTVGYLVTMFFIIFRAPDLALTQMIVETVSVSLFLLCFYHMPKLKKELSKLRFRLSNALIAAGVGLMVTLIALGAGGSGKFASIADFFVEESYKLAGGKNIVNVILVDFRGFDTLLEIMVLGIASLGIFTMIKLRLEGRDIGARVLYNKGELSLGAVNRDTASQEVTEAHEAYEAAVRAKEASMKGGQTGGQKQ
nr:Na+/H+ antiporter subunit A [Paenibacillus eucommiae]